MVSGPSTVNSSLRSRPGSITWRPPRARRAEPRGASTRARPARSRRARPAPAGRRPGRWWSRRSRLLDHAVGHQDAGDRGHDGGRGGRRGGWSNRARRPQPGAGDRQHDRAQQPDQDQAVDEPEACQAFFSSPWACSRAACWFSRWASSATTPPVGSDSFSISRRARRRLTSTSPGPSRTAGSARPPWPRRRSAEPRERHARGAGSCSGSGAVSTGRPVASVRRSAVLRRSSRIAIRHAWPARAPTSASAIHAAPRSGRRRRRRWSPAGPALVGDPRRRCRREGDQRHGARRLPGPGGRATRRPHRDRPPRPRPTISAAPATAISHSPILNLRRSICAGAYPARRAAFSVFSRSIAASSAPRRRARA